MPPKMLYKRIRKMIEDQIDREGCDGCGVIGDDAIDSLVEDLVNLVLSEVESAFREAAE